MAVQNFTPSPTEVDLEATAELPAIDFSGSDADTAAATDVHASPGIPAGVADLAASMRDAEQRLLRKMERVAGLEGDLSNALRTAVELRAQLDHESVQGTRRENVLRETEQRLTLNTERLGVLEGELATAKRQATDLQEQLDQERTKGTRQEASLRETQQRLTVNTERVGVLEAELATAKRQTVELQGQLDQERFKSTRQETALADTEQRLARNTERVSTLEGELAIALRQAAELRAQLDQERSQGMRRETDLRERADGLDKQIQGLRQEMVQRDAAQRRQTDDMIELRRCNERTLEALQTWQGFRGVTEAQMLERDEIVVQIEAQHAAQVATAEARNAELQLELGAARVSANARVTALEESLRQALAARQEQEAAMLAARQEQEAAMQVQRQLNDKLQAQLDLAATKTSQLEQDLGVAEEHIHRLESEAHASAALLGSLQQNVERLARDDSGSRPALRVVVSEPAQRVLIRQVDGAEVVFTLGKRTTIGRTSDNDIHLDTTFISRHHAVLLSNPEQCVVEDLNSTNGVMVNGRPVNRQALRDGDTLTIGKTEFRYQQRA